MTLYLLQLLRFFAALLVLLFHLELLSSGYKGVDLFFVISGFVMFYTTVQLKRKDPLLFFVHRLTKIFLLYWLAMLTLYFVIRYALDTVFLKAILLIPGHHSILGVSWSLSSELYFYFLFGGLIFFLPLRLSKLIFLLLLLVSTAITLLNTTTYSLKGSAINFLLGQNLWEFLLGIACGYLFSKPKAVMSAGLAAATLLLTALAFVVISVPYNNPWSFVVYGSLSFLLVLSATAYEKSRKLSTGWQFITGKAGEASYAIYLFGPVITLMIQPVSLSARLLTILLTIAASLLISQWIENPLLKRSRHAILRLLRYSRD